MISTRAILPAVIAVLCCTLSTTGAAQTKPPSLEQKYSVTGFENLNWEILPAEYSGIAMTDEGEWALACPGGTSIYAVAPYNERDYGIACEVTFPRRLPPGERVSVLFNYHYYETLDKADYAEIRLYPDGRFEFGHSDNGFMILQQEGRFPLLHSDKRLVKFYFAKLRNELHLVINGKTSVIKVGVEAKQGSFGFALPPDSSAVLRNFKFTVFREVDVPFERVNVVDLFAPKKTGS
jgi:hypothetical protein